MLAGEASSFSGFLTRVDIGHIRIGSGGNGRIKLRGSGSLFTMLQLTLLAARRRIFHGKVFGTPVIATSGASSGRGASMAEWRSNC